MARLIDAEKVEEKINECVWDAYGSNEDEMAIAYSTARGIIEDAPTVDAVPASFIEKWKEGRTVVEKLIADKILMDWKVEQWTEEERNGIYRC